MSGAFGKFPQSCFQTNRSLEPAVARAAVALEGRPDTKKQPVLSGHFASTYGDVFFTGNICDLYGMVSVMIFGDFFRTMATTKQ